MTYREAFNAVRVMTYDQTRLARMGSDDRVLRKVAGWRIHQHAEYLEILMLICGHDDVEHSAGGNRYHVLGKPKASIVAVRERAERERLAAA